MSSQADVTRPPGATHVMWFYGDVHYFRKSVTLQYNEVSGGWQSVGQWHSWNFKTQLWEGVGSGFSSRRLKELD